MYKSFVAVVLLSVFVFGECDKKEPKSEELEIFISSTCSGDLEYKEEKDEQSKISIVEQKPTSSIFEPKK